MSAGRAPSWLVLQIHWEYRGLFINMSLKNLHMLTGKVWGSYSSDNEN